MKKNLLKILCILAVVSIIFSSCSRYYYDRRDRDAREYHHHHWYHDRDHDRDRDYH
ncbi:MAG: hypothetical protein ABIY62_04615 [Ginsengibacter sp.]